MIESGQDGDAPRRGRRRNRSRKKAGSSHGPQPVKLAALDLGTNNCRLLIATPKGSEFRVVDAFSRIVRLGEGMSRTGALSDAAMDRAVAALKICADKISRRGVTHGRYIATQACRAAANGGEFLQRVKDETGLDFEVISTAEEARLAVNGCIDLFDQDAKAGLVFDIGGGSTEISWVRPDTAVQSGSATTPKAPEIAAWTSLPIGVVTLSEKWGGRNIDEEIYRKVVASVRELIRDFGDPAELRAHFDNGQAHFLGTSGTVTSIAGVHLELARYRRDQVDGLWLSTEQARDVSQRLCTMTYEERANEPCIGPERADLVVCGCAILEALLQEWPVSRIRVGDRGLREGILSGLSEKSKRRRRRRRRKPRKETTHRDSSAIAPSTN